MCAVRTQCVYTSSTIFYTTKQTNFHVFVWYYTFLLLILCRRLRKIARANKQHANTKEHACNRRFALYYIGYPTKNENWKPVNNTCHRHPTARFHCLRYIFPNYFPELGVYLPVCRKVINLHKGARVSANKAFDFPGFQITYLSFIPVKIRNIIDEIWNRCNWECLVDCSVWQTLMP